MSVRVLWGSTLDRLIADISDAARVGGERVALMAAGEIQRQISDLDLVATRALLRSVAVRRVQPWRWEVGPTVAYAIYADQGRRPGRQPPVAAIAAWMRAKGLGDWRRGAWAIARAIAQRGVRPRRYMQRAYEIVRRDAQRVFEQTVREVLR